MAMTIDDIKALVGRHRTQSEAIGVAVLAILASLIVGTAAKRAAAPSVAERTRLRVVGQEIADFRRAFQTSTPEQDAIRLPDSLSVTVDHDARLSVAQRMAQRAEGSGMRDVRVRFATADSAALPPIPEIAGGAAQPAPYAITLDATGGFAAVLSFVKQLPPSVTLQRLSAVRSPKNEVQYHLTLVVFETAGQNQHG